MHLPLRFAYSYTIQWITTKSSKTVQGQSNIRQWSTITIIHQQKWDNFQENTKLIKCLGKHMKNRGRVSMVHCF